MTEPVEVADPRHYFRLLLSRLLETQKILQCYSNLPAELKSQQYFNASTLSEIKSWLEETGDDWEISRSSSTRPSLAISGPNFSTTSGPKRGSPWDIVRQGNPTPPDGLPENSLEASSPRSSLGTTISRSTNGRILFLPPSSPAKPDSTSNGGASMG